MIVLISSYVGKGLARELFKSILRQINDPMSKLIRITLALLVGFVAACSSYTPEQEAELARGKEVYIANCISCHGSDGRGLGGPYPSLIRETITEDYAVRARYLIEKGSPGDGGMMPVHLSQKEITEVINYIQNSWGNKAAFQVMSDPNQISKK